MNIGVVRSNSYDSWDEIIKLALPKTQVNYLSLEKSSKEEWNACDILVYIFMDVNTPAASSLCTIINISERHGLPLLCITGNLNPHYWNEIMEFGVKGLINVSTDFRSFQHALQVISKGGTFIDPPPHHLIKE